MLKKKKAYANCNKPLLAKQYHPHASGTWLSHCDVKRIWNFIWEGRNAYPNVNNTRVKAACPLIPDLTIHSLGPTLWEALPKQRNVYKYSYYKPVIFSNHVLGSVEEYKILKKKKLLNSPYLMSDVSFYKFAIVQRSPLSRICFICWNLSFCVIFHISCHFQHCYWQSVLHC